jgi:hypothetical protein
MSNPALLGMCIIISMAYAHILARIDNIFWNSTASILKRHFTNYDVVMIGNHDTGYTSSSMSGVLQHMPHHVHQ